MDDLEMLLTERAITRVLYAYAHSVDRRDFPGIRTCYWDDGTDEHTGFSGSVPDYCAWLEDVLPKVDTTTHQFGNVTIDVDPSGERAESEAYCINVCVWGPSDDGTARHLSSGLRYLDTWERRAGEWRVLRRRCVADWRRIDEDVTVADG